MRLLEIQQLAVGGGNLLFRLRGLHFKLLQVLLAAALGQPAFVLNKGFAKRFRPSNRVFAAVGIHREVNHVVAVFAGRNHRRSHQDIRVDARFGGRFLGQLAALQQRNLGVNRLHHRRIGGGLRGRRHDGRSLHQQHLSGGPPLRRGALGQKRSGQS